MLYSDYSTQAIFQASVTLYLFIAFIVSLFSIICFWKIFEKAGEPGWKSIIPIYSAYVFFKITFGNGWLFLLSFVPIINIVISIICLINLARAFGKGGGFVCGLIFLNPIFIAILAFDSSVYIGPNS